MFNLMAGATVTELTTITMAALSSHSFVIQAADQINVTTRAIRRFFVSNSVMKLANSCAGDIVVLAPAYSNGDSPTAQQTVRTYMSAIGKFNSILVFRDHSL
jgi:hypothetical protein